MPLEWVHDSIGTGGDLHRWTFGVTWQARRLYVQQLWVQPSSWKTSLRSGIALVLHPGAMDCLVAPQVRDQILSDHRAEQPPQPSALEHIV
jgi:hypothetical protein